MILNENLFLILSFAITCGLIYKFIYPKINSSLSEKVGEIRKKYTDKQENIIQLTHEVECLKKSINELQKEITQKNLTLNKGIEIQKRSYNEKIIIKRTKEQENQDLKNKSLEAILANRLKKCMISNVLESIEANARNEIMDQTTQDQYITNALAILSKCTIK